MKSKVLLWTLFVVAYLMPIPFIVYLAISMNNEEASESLVNIAIALPCVFAVIAFIICFVIILNAVFSYRKEVECPYKLTLSVKLGLIPFYIINFILWGLIIVACTIYLWLLWGVAIFMLLISVLSSYIIMLSTGANNIVYSIKDFKRTHNFVYLLCLAGHFIFCIDVIAAIVLYIKGKAD